MKCAGSRWSCWPRRLPRGAAGWAKTIFSKTNVYLSLMGEPFRPNESGEDPFDQWLKLADQDGDGAISRLEFRADAEAFFAPSIRAATRSSMATKWPSMKIWRRAGPGSPAEAARVVEQPAQAQILGPGRQRTSPPSLRPAMRLPLPASTRRGARQLSNVPRARRHGGPQYRPAGHFRRIHQDGRPAIFPSITI